MHDWLRTGVQLLWYVDPDTGDTTVYHGDRIRYVTADETLSGEDVLPGFTLRMREVLDELAAWSAPDEAPMAEGVADPAADR
jgi:Uma2 family endonuclease